MYTPLQTAVRCKSEHLQVGQTHTERQRERAGEGGRKEGTGTKQGVVVVRVVVVLAGQVWPVFMRTMYS